MMRAAAAGVLLLVLSACERPAPTAKPTPAPAPAPQPAPAPVVIETPPVLAPPADTKPTFLPSRHGFAFVNAFKGSPLPPNLRSLERVLGSQVPERFGLCGGMCLAAADFFTNGVPIPTDTTPPADGDPLYAALYQRQLDSFNGLSLPLRVLQLMTAPDRGENGLYALTAKELPALRARLAKGELVPLCLILGKADGKTKPWDNHQILAYADASTGEATTLRVYDPNYPKDDQAILTFTTRHDGLETLLTTHRAGRPKPLETPVRGLFATPYTQQTPIPTPTPALQKKDPAESGPAIPPPIGR